MFSDRTGSIFGSEFTDLYDRMSLGVRRTRHDSDGATQYGIYNTMSPYSTPVATLDYGAGGTLGTVTFNGTDGSVRTHAMSSFLTEVGGLVVVFVVAVFPSPFRPASRQLLRYADASCVRVALSVPAIANSPLQTRKSTSGAGERTHKIASRSGP